MAVIPADARHPHSEQTGWPPNWHGVMRVARSAERHSVLWAKMHSAGEAGGRRYPSKTCRGRCTFGKRCAKVASSSKARARSSLVRRSAESLPACDQLHFNIHAFQFGKQLTQLAVAHQRLSADDGNVKWTVPTNQSEHAIDQLRTAIISELAQRSIPEMLRLVGITAGTM